MNDVVLKNPVWYALEQTHKKWIIEYNGVKFYDPEICPFGSFEDPAKVEKALNEYAKLTSKFFLVTDQDPIYDEKKIELIKKINGCQMVLTHLIANDITEDIVQLDDEYVDEIYELIWKVMPGYYRKRSYEMGDYYGIIKDNKLVSVAGQRMQMDDYVEISGVVTDPDYTKRGLAGQLVTHCTREILKCGKHPILHTTIENPAIRLYEKLGYELTRRMNWWYFRSN